MVELSAWLNIVGLLFDIFGVVLIYRFGISPTMGSTKDRVVVIDGKVTPITTYLWKAGTGLGLLIFGFSLQAAGSAALLCSLTSWSACLVVDVIGNFFGKYF